MTDQTTHTLARLLMSCIGEARTRNLFRILNIYQPFLDVTGDEVSRAILAQALTMILFDDLLDRVPSARNYVNSVGARERKVTFDHGALRTVKGRRMGGLPAGEAAFARILEPLGYAVDAVYPLTKISMTGRAYTHREYSEQIPQFFVSELHPERFSDEFQQAVNRVLATSRDPLTPESVRLLAKIGADGTLGVDEAVRLLRDLATCFSRQHAIPSLADYRILLAESPEMAWIATEGNSFNHATDRVNDIESLVRDERQQGHPIKDRIEISASGRIRQTAYRAGPITRTFRSDDGGTVTREVPGSYFEFISRAPLPGGSGLDLGFDAGNAQVIFTMTTAN